MKTMKKLLLLMTIAAMTTSFAACGSKNNSRAASGNTAQTESKQSEVFPKFEGKDMDGNTVDNSMFSKNEATLLNFWFNGCSACVNEMPALEKFNARLREKGAELVGVNVQANESKEALDEAKEILSKQGVTYRNLVIDEEQEARRYIANIFSFPTTIIVDKNGNIVGNPILGSIEDEKKLDQILQVVDDIKAGKDISGASVTQKTTDNELEALLTEENKLFTEHNNVWDKLFAKIKKEKVPESEKMPYAEFLKSQVEEYKDSFSAEELNTLNSDLEKIAEIEEQISKLDK